MNTFLCRRGPVAELAGGGGDLGVSSEGDVGADRGGDPSADRGGDTRASG
jgi:hypothetical protein